MINFNKYLLTKETPALAMLLLFISYMLLLAFTIVVIGNFITWTPLENEAYRFLLVALVLLQISSYLNKGLT
jgi:hypothetical protein